jgi:ABC-2 type transport system ATP-binding protein
VAAGTPSELARQAAGEQVLFGAPPRLDVASLGAAVGAVVEETAPGRYVVRAPGSPQLTARLAQWLAEHDAVIDDLRTTRSLEDAYLALVGETGAAP